jgi:hypothetical protein
VVSEAAVRSSTCSGKRAAFQALTDDFTERGESQVSKNRASTSDNTSPIPMFQDL